MATNNNTEVTFEIMEHIGVIDTYPNRDQAWTKEVNIVSWNGADAKLDIRNWHPGRARSGKGITLNQDETLALYEALNSIFSFENDL